MLMPIERWVGWRTLAAVQKTRAVGALLVVPFGAIASPSLAQDMQWVGCYEVERGGWDRARVGEDRSQFEPPRFIRLHSEFAESRLAAGRWLVEPAMVSYRHAPGSWAPLADDSLSIIWTTGFTGASMRLAMSGDSLLGTVTAFSDDKIAGVPDPSAPVVLRPRRCADLASRSPGEARPVRDDVS